jgi:HrpA-like RNA helicase
MAQKYRNEDKSKPNLTQTQSSTSEDVKLNKAKQLRRDQDNVKNVSVGIYDIDSAFSNFLQNDVKPTIEDDGRFYPVPVMYASPEKWASAQRDGFMKDDNGMMLTPVISFKRNNLSINTDLAKLKVAENEDTHQMFERTYTKVNRYDQFSVLTGQTPKKEYMSVERPDYVNLEYEVVVWCDYMEQVNKIVEQIVFFQGRSFGDRYKFVIKGDSYSFETISEMGQDRITKASINLTAKAYIVPEYAAMSNNTKRRISVGKVSWGENSKLGGNESYPTIGNE